MNVLEALEPTPVEKMMWHRHNVLGEDKSLIADDVGCSVQRIRSAHNKVDRWLQEYFKDVNKWIANTHAQRLEFLYLQAIKSATMLDDQIELLEDDDELGRNVKAGLRVKFSNQAETHRLAASKYMEKARRIWGIDAATKTAMTNADGDGSAKMEVSYEDCTSEELAVIKSAQGILARLSGNLEN